MLLGELNADVSYPYVIYILSIVYIPGSRVVRESHRNTEESSEVLFLHTTFTGE